MKEMSIWHYNAHNPIHFLCIAVVNNVTYFYYSQPLGYWELLYPETSVFR